MGFRKLIVEFDSPCNLRPDLPWPNLEQAQAVSRSQCEELKEYKLKYLFEPAYGPAVQSDVHNVCNGSYTCHLEFHPRQYLAKKLIV